MPNRPTEKHREIIEYSGGHLRVLGPPASGKTSLLLERYRHLEAAGANAAVVTYTRDSAGRLTAELLAKDSARFGRVPVYTYHALSREIARTLPGESTTVIGEMEESVLLRRVLRRVEKTISSDYRNALESATFQRTILGVLHALSQNGIDGETCDEMIGSAASSRVRDLVRVYAAYRKYLRSHGYTTYYDEAWRAAGLVDELPAINPLARADVVLIDDFHDVDPGQYALVRAVAPPEGHTRVEVFGDPTGARFRETGTTDRYLLDVFPREYKPLDAVLPAGFAGDPALGPVVRALLDETIGVDADRFVPPAPGGTGNGGDRVTGGLEVRLHIADDEVAEAADVADRAVALLDSGGYSPSEVAVVAREKHKYESVLVRAFRERGLALDTGRARQHAFAYFVTSLLSYVETPENEAAKNAVTSSPYFASLQAANEMIAGAPAQADQIRTVENIRSEIRRTSKSKDASFDLSRCLEKWVRPVLTSSKGANTPVGMLAFLGSLADEWCSYVEVVEGTGGRRSISEFLSLSRSLAGGERGAPVTAGRVGFYSCRELSSERFPVVFVVGCSELLFPALPSREDYVPYGAIQDLLRTVVTDRPVELHAARTGEEFLKSDYALLSTAITRARRQLLLTAPERHHGMSCPAPSRILESIPDDCVVRGVGRSPAPYFRYVKSLGRGRGDAMQTGHRLSDLWGMRPVAARTIDPEVKRLSPSSIKSYTICPRRHFYERILRIEDERTPAATFGTLFHDLMKSLAHEHRTHDALRSVIHSDRIDQYIDEEIEKSGSFDRAAGIVQRAARFHLRDMAERFVDLDAARDDDYRITEVEEWIDFEHDGRQFGGIADRIDEASGGARVVIDYKTGGGINKTGKTLRRKALPGFDDPGERLWQIPLYLRGARADDGRDPRLFCYYVIRPGDEHYVAGLYVGQGDVVESAGVFDEKLKKRFAFLTPEELEACLDEASAVAEELFARKTEYVRTSNRDHCSNCYFKRVCERMA